MRLFTLPAGYRPSNASSRSPRAGSIAADALGHGRAGGAAVIPLTTSGLHCGGEEPGYDEDLDDESSRSPRAGSIAAPPASAPTRAWRWSSRSPRAGSIAAPLAVQDRGVVGGVIPLTTSGLHCGFTPHARALRPETSSRSPRAGSIAAAWPRSPTPHSTTSSRSPRAGSIAAPRCQRGTVQRLGSSSRSPRAGSIAAPRCQRGTVQRLGSSSRSPRAGSIAAPPASAPTRAWRCRHPAHHERAPLRRMGVLRSVRAGRRHPAHHERAPLRQVVPDHAERLGDVSSRSPRAGSIAAEPSTRRLAQVRRVIPLTTSGLHCGRHALRPRRRQRAPSSRSPRAGSIAAGATRGRRRCLPAGHPAHHERAPLRRLHRLHQPDPARRHPAHHERAPLRPCSAEVFPSSDLSHPAHHERAPLRLTRVAGRR